MFKRYLLPACLLLLTSLGYLRAEDATFVGKSSPGVHPVAANTGGLRSILARVPELGSVDEIDRLKRRIWIDDEGYRLASGVRVWLSKARWGTLSSIRRGDIVKIKFSTGKGNARTITEIRILRRAKQRERDGA